MQRQIDEGVSTGSTFDHNTQLGPDRSNWTLYKDDRLLSDFDPTDDNQTISDWLQKVNECARQTKFWPIIS
jgi:hypothetical protein